MPSRCTTSASKQKTNKNALSTRSVIGVASWFVELAVIESTWVRYSTVGRGRVPHRSGRAFRRQDPLVPPPAYGRRSGSWNDSAALYPAESVQWRFRRSAANRRPAVRVLSLPSSRLTFDSLLMWLLLGSI